MTPAYEIRLAGHLDDHWSTWFGGLTVVHEDDGTTTLRAAVADQAELHGVLAKVRDLGATLISVTPTRTTIETEQELLRSVSAPTEPTTQAARR